MKKIWSKCRKSGWTCVGGAAIAVVLATGFASFVSILLNDGIDRDWCFDSTCWNEAATIYEVPISIAAAVLILVGVVVAFRRLGASKLQTQSIIYQDSRSEFMAVLDSWGFEKLSFLNLTRTGLFAALYPDARRGDPEMSPQIEAILSDDLPGDFESLSEVPVTDPARFRNQTYVRIFQLFQLLREELPIDPTTNFGGSGTMIDGESGRAYSESAHETLTIASAVNEFEGMRFFTNQQRRIWRRGVEQLQDSVAIANQITEFWKEPAARQWHRALWSDNKEDAALFDVGRALGTDLWQEEAVRRYIYQSLTTGQGALPKALHEFVANQLHVDPSKI